MQFSAQKIIPMLIPVWSKQKDQTKIGEVWHFAQQIIKEDCIFLQLH